jgi:hypothetical protein
MVPGTNSTAPLAITAPSVKGRPSTLIRWKAVRSRAVTGTRRKTRCNRVNKASCSRWTHDEGTRPCSESRHVATTAPGAAPPENRVPSKSVATQSGRSEGEQGHDWDMTDEAGKSFGATKGGKPFIGNPARESAGRLRPTNRIGKINLLRLPSRKRREFPQKCRGFLSSPSRRS